MESLDSGEIMKKLLLLLSLLISSNLYSLEKEVSWSFERTWNEVVQALVIEGAIIGLNDKTSGVIQASSTLLRNHYKLYYPSCNAPGRVISITSNISVVVKEVNSDRSKVIVSFKGAIESYRQSRILFIKTGKTSYFTNCESNGKLEEKLLSSFSKF